MQTLETPTVTPDKTDKEIAMGLRDWLANIPCSNPVLDTRCATLKRLGRKPTRKRSRPMTVEEQEWCKARHHKSFAEATWAAFNRCKKGGYGRRWRLRPLREALEREYGYCKESEGRSGYER
jgi:hypothetical protein